MYIYACLFLGFVPILCAGAGYGVVKLQNRRRRRLRTRQEELKCSSGSKAVDKMAVREWLHANHRRLVKVRFGPEAALHTVDRKGEPLRTVALANYQHVTVEESQARALDSLRVHPTPGALQQLRTHPEYTCLLF